MAARDGITEGLVRVCELCRTLFLQWLERASCNRRVERAPHSPRLFVDQDCGPINVQPCQPWLLLQLQLYGNGHE
jgi:hypothetical protein